jgi:hypothetical protein
MGSMRGFGSASLVRIAAFSVALAAFALGTVAADLAAPAEPQASPGVAVVMVDAQAGHIGLGVTDGRLLWPVPVELR